MIVQAHTLTSRVQKIPNLTNRKFKIEEEGRTSKFSTTDCLLAPTQQTPRTPTDQPSERTEQARQTSKQVRKKKQTPPSTIKKDM